MTQHREQIVPAGDVRHQRLQLPFGEPSPGGGQERQDRADQLRVEILLQPLDHLDEDGRDRVPFPWEVADPGVELLERPEPPQLLQGHQQKQRVGRGRVAQKQTHLLLVERLGRQRRHLADDPPPLLILQRPDPAAAELPPAKGFQLRIFRAGTRDAACNHLDVPRQLLRQPVQLAGLVGLVELIHRVDGQHHPALGRNAGQVAAKAGDQLVRLLGQLSTEPEPLGQHQAEPPEHVVEARRMGARAHEVRNYQRLGMAGAVLRHESGQGGRFARSGRPDHHAGNLVVPVGELGQVLLDTLPAHVHPKPRLHKPLVVVLLFGQRVPGGLGRRHLGQVLFGADGLPKLVPNAPAKRFQPVEAHHPVAVDDLAQLWVESPVLFGIDGPIGRHVLQGMPVGLAQLRGGQPPVDPQTRIPASILRDRQPGLADSALEFLELPGRLRAFHVQLPVDPWGHVGQELRIAEVEGRTVVHLGALEHAVEDFQLRDALARVVLHPAVLAQGLGREGPRHPAVALAQDAHEMGPAPVDLRQAQVEDLVVVGLLLGHTPTQIDIDQVDAVLLQPGPQFREDHFDQVVPLRVHVAEGGGDEDADGFPFQCHRPSLLSNATFRYSSRRIVPSPSQSQVQVPSSSKRVKVWSPKVSRSI